jgi:hypothetical protein
LNMHLPRQAYFREDPRKSAAILNKSLKIPPKLHPIIPSRSPRIRPRRY